MKITTFCELSPLGRLCAVCEAPPEELEDLVRQCSYAEQLGAVEDAMCERRKTNYLDRVSGNYLIQVTLAEAKKRADRTRGGRFNLVPDSRWTAEEREFFQENELDTVDLCPCVVCGELCQCYRADGPFVYCGCKGGEPQCTF